MRNKWINKNNNQQNYINYFIQQSTTLYKYYNNFALETMFRIAFKLLKKKQEIVQILYLH